MKSGTDNAGSPEAGESVPEQQAKKTTPTKRRLPLLIAAIALVAVVLLAGPAWEWLRETYAAHAPRTTQYPAGAQPDQVCLTWSGDPRTTQTIQWRTAASSNDGAIQYRRRDTNQGNEIEKAAECLTLDDPLITNDPTVSHFITMLDGLEPATTYTYRVGDAESGQWTSWSEFTTAPASTASFSFGYFGDVQEGFDAWGGLLRQAYERQPDAAFYVIAGDLVNRGNCRDEWDSLFHAASGVFNERPLVPAIGNHECPNDSEPRLYLDLLALPENGPENVPAERAYSFQYGNALFVVLDTNLEPEAQSSWLEQQLADSDATWKFAVYHHPAYSAKGYRRNADIREAWGHLFDAYHVDVAFQGHDHAYLRTHPMRAGQIVGSPAEGTIYIIAVAGTKYYELKKNDYAAAGIADTSTYQVIDIETTGPDTLVYRAYDADGRLRDEMAIVKGP